MLSRFTMYRGPRPSWDLSPKGIRQDTRKHSRHCLRPTAELVTAYLAAPSEGAWRRFSQRYLAMIEQRFRQDRVSFDALAALATENDVYIGCSCPTTKNPVWGRCHTFLALRFMKMKYSKLKVVIPMPPVTSEQGVSAKRQSNKSNCRNQRGE